MINLKNEGSVLVGLILLSFTVLIAKKFPRHQIMSMTISPAIAFLPFLVWVVQRRIWNLENDMGLSADFFHQIGKRITDPEAIRILIKFLFTDAGTPNFLLFLIAAAIICHRSLRLEWRAAIIPALVGFAYYGICAVIYIGTHHDLSWHLSYSYNRLELSINAAFISCTFQIISLQFASTSTNPEPDCGLLHQ